MNPVAPVTKYAMTETLYPWSRMSAHVRGGRSRRGVLCTRGGEDDASRDADAASYQPPDQSALAVRRFLAALRASLRLSSRHWRRLNTRISVGKNAITMKPAFVTTLSSAAPYVPW